MDMDETVCTCVGVTNGMIKDAVYNGANTMEEIQEITGAGTVCGACLENVQHLLECFIAERDRK